MLQNIIRFLNSCLGLSGEPTVFSLAHLIYLLPRPAEEDTESKRLHDSIKDIHSGLNYAFYWLTKNFCDLKDLTLFAKFFDDESTSFETNLRFFAVAEKELYTKFLPDIVVTPQQVALIQNIPSIFPVERPVISETSRPAVTPHCNSSCTSVSAPSVKYSTG